MPDSQALRSRRSRQHKAGDHSLCLSGHCPDAHGLPQIREVPAGSGRNLDPTAGLQDLAAQLAEAYAADPANALLARELRMTLQSLKPAAAAPTPLQEFLDELRA